MISYDCADRLNEIINHPEVITGHLVNGSKPPFDVSSNLKNGGFGVLGEGFGFLLDFVGAGVYEVHTSILPEYRKQSVQITLESMAEVFTETATMEIVTRIKDNKPARHLATAVGMQKIFARDGFEFFSIHISRWAALSTEFMELGEQFHELLEAHEIETDHPLDDNHNQYVGIAIAMASAGLYEKAIWFYNVWAKLAGFHAAEMVDDNKAFIGNVIVEFIDDEMRVIKCQ
jgi:hypothetical protein